jgi:hypothetical protein
MSVAGVDAVRVLVGGAISARPDRRLEARIVAATVRVAVAAFLIQATIHLVNFAVFDLRIQTLDAGAEGTAFTWASVVATSAGGFACLLHVVLLDQHRRRYAVLGLLLAFFSLDDLLQIHEIVAFHTFTGLGVWDGVAGRLFPALYLPILALAFWLIRAVVSGVSSDVQRLGNAGLAALVLAILLELGSAVAAAIIGNDLLDAGLAYELEIVAEEGAELAGWIAVSGALTCVVLRDIVEAASPFSPPN